MPLRAARPTAETDGVSEGPPILDDSRFRPESRRSVSAPGLRAFRAIADEWGLSETERIRILGFPARSTYFNWMARLDRSRTLILGVDTLLRVSAVLGICKALIILFPRPADRLAWLRNPNAGPLFGGQRPIDVLSSGTQDALMLVRRHLDAWRGGVFAPPNAADSAFEPFTDDDLVIV